MTHCSECGAKVRANAQFCAECGAEFEADDEDTVEAEYTEEDNERPASRRRKSEEVNVQLKINESFSTDDEKILLKIKENKFEPLNLLNLKLRAEEVAKETEIKELISYNLIKKNLEYNLPHQQDGALKILRDMDGRALLADEVGLGKTITAGMVLKECIVRGFVKKALILTPPSLVEQWKAELSEKFELEFDVVENEKDWEYYDFAIASIDKVKGLDREGNGFKHDSAHQIYWDIVILDEAHKLKDRTSQRWKFVDRLQKKRFLMLTATPFQNDLLELFNLLYLLRRGHLGTISEFKDNFLDKGNKRKPLNVRELKRKLGEVMVRRRRDETKVKYKKRIPKIEAVKLSPEEFKIYEGIQDLLANNYKDHRGIDINSILAIYTILPKITSSSRSAMESLSNISTGFQYHETTRNLAKEILKEYERLNKDSKIEVLMKIIEHIFSKDKEAKLLIYTKHPSTLKYISSKLKKYKVVEFMGGLDRHEKTAKISEFKEKAQIMISTETGAEGLNFQFCSNLVNYDLPWNPMAVEQRIGRLDRIGQTKNIAVYSLATRDTMEEHVVDLIINKMCCIGLVIGELPIILFNMGLDSKSSSGSNMVEERLMRAYLDSKNNLDKFASNVDDLGKDIEKGVKEYEQTKESNSGLLD